MGGHSGIAKCLKTISQRSYCPNLAEQQRVYITICHQKRIILNVPAMTKISMDIKEVPSNHGYSHILVLLCEVSNFLLPLPLHSIRGQHVVEVFKRGYLAYFCPPSHINCDLDPAFTSSLMAAFLQNLNIKMITVSVTNNKSLLAEHGIKSLSNLLAKHLPEVWLWYNILPYAILCYNSYSTPNLDGFSLYKLVFGHKIVMSYVSEIKPFVVVSGMFKTYHEKLKENEPPLLYITEVQR